MATKTFQYRFRCVTEDCNVYVWKADGEATPDKCPNNTEHTVDLSGLAIVDTVQQQDVNIASATAGVTIGSQTKGFRDMTGHNVYRFGDLLYDCAAGKTSIFMEKFSTTMYLCGGGLRIPDFMYVSGQKVDNKPEKGDYCTFDLVDVDNVTGYTKSFSISKVARASNVATITTATAHNFVTGEVCCINPDDNTFDDMEEAITVVDSTHITYANTGNDVAEKDATGKIGKILVVAVFVPKDYISPAEDWICKEDDGKPVPATADAGIYLRFRYVSTGSTDVVAMPFYSMRT